MRFEWDSGKAKANLRKHGISFEEASTVFYDPFAITTEDAEHWASEDRRKTIGTSVKLRVLMVVHTERVGQVNRIVSARKATGQEANDYAEEVKNRLAQEE